MQASTDLPPADRAFLRARARRRCCSAGVTCAGALGSAEAAADLARRGRDDRQLAESLRNIGTIRELTGSNGLAALRRVDPPLRAQPQPPGRGVGATTTWPRPSTTAGMWDLAIEHYELLRRASRDRSAT